MKTNSIKTYFTIAFFLSLAIGITIHFPLVMSFLFGDEGRHHGEKFIVSFSHLGGEMFITFLVAILMFTLNFFILNPVARHGKLKLFSVMISVLLTLGSVTLLNHLLSSFLHFIEAGPMSHGYQEEIIYRNFFVSALVIGCIFIIRVINQKQLVQFENETLRREALQSQFESLKNQLSPHFLFNSLTALKTLINEAPDTAQDYVNNLSKALRYTLQSNEKQLVTLKEELDFTESYLFLIKMRYDSNLVINMEISEKYSDYRLPPLTIQTLVENAVKHNEVSKRNPLKITILTTDNEILTVRNNIQEKITEEEGTGIGLTNLSKQFSLLLGKEIIIKKEKGEFRVEVPLIKQ
jgi:sensor histidine kinase YesM